MLKSYVALAMLAQFSLLIPVYHASTRTSRPALIFSREWSKAGWIGPAHDKRGQRVWGFPTVNGEGFNSMETSRKDENDKEIRYPRPAPGQPGLPAAARLNSMPWLTALRTMCSSGSYNRS